jgi:hypothetical protein
MKPCRLTPNEIAIAHLLEHRKYYREEKIPALERLFDVLKEGLAASGGNAASWLLSEYNEVHRQIEEAQHVIREIEARIQGLGQTVEGLDDLEKKIEYGDPT